MLDERVVAAFAALSGRDRLSGLVIAYDADPEIARCSPGELILHEVVRSAIARGFTTFDLGVGEARYKNECCEATETLFDTFVTAKPAWPSRRPRLPPRAARQANRQAFAQAVGLGGAPAPPELQAASWKAGSADFTLKARISG